MTKSPVSAVPAILLVLILLTVAAYSRAPAGGILEYDDENYVTKNQVVLDGLTWDGFQLAWTQSYAGNWSPLTWLSLMLDVTLFGVNARVFHLENVALHVANTLLFFLLLRAMTGTLWRCALVAALFAVHPLHVESVAWISGRKDVLSTFFGLAALLAYLRYVRQRDGASYGAATVALALGLSSKAMLVTWPLLMLTLDFWPLGRMRRASVRTAAQLVGEKAPWFFLAALVSVFTFFSQSRGGAVSPLDGGSVISRIGNALWAYGAYLGKTLLPLQLSAFYPYRERSLVSGEVLGATLALVVLAAVCLFQLRRRPWLAFAGGWYVLSLLPVIGLVRVGLQSMADRYTYVPLIGAFLAVAWAAAEWSGTRPVRRVVAGGVMSVLLGLLAALTWVQVGYWKDERSVYSRMISAVEGNYFGYFHLAVLNEREGNTREAERLYREGLRTDPTYGEPHERLGVMLAGAGRSAEAVIEFRAAIALGQGNPLVNYLLGVALLEIGHPEEALEPLREAVRMKPDFAEAYNNLGVALGDLGRGEDAVLHYRRALEINPGLVQARENLDAVEGNR